MGELEQKLIRRAILKHKKIFPCSRKSTFEASFTRESNRILFWYNTKDRSTHVVSARLIRRKHALSHKTS